MLNAATELIISVTTEEKRQSRRASMGENGSSKKGASNYKLSTAQIFGTKTDAGRLIKSLQVKEIDFPRATMKNRSFVRLVEEWRI